VDCSVVRRHAAPGHHLLKIGQAQAVSQVPPNTTLPSIREPWRTS
jgi:hypothetical protein